MAKLVLAIVGMPGSGKTEVANLLKEKGLPLVRFGDETDRGLKELGLPYTPENERMYREKIRKELGMAAYAIKAKPAIEKILKEKNVVVLDGLYSWEEYIFLEKDFEELKLICVFSEASIRYERLAKRPIRPVSIEEARKRDIDEIEKLNKGGPIAIADYFIENNGTIKELEQKIEALLQRLGIKEISQ